MIVGNALGIGVAFNFIDFAIIRRYFVWSKQTLSPIVLWTGEVYLHQEKCNHLMASVPAGPVGRCSLQSTYVHQQDTGALGI